MVTKHFCLGSSLGHVPELGSLLHAGLLPAPGLRLGLCCLRSRSLKTLSTFSVSRSGLQPRLRLRPLPPQRLPLSRDSWLLSVSYPVGPSPRALPVAFGPAAGAWGFPALSDCVAA